MEKIVIEVKQKVQKVSGFNRVLQFRGGNQGIGKVGNKLVKDINKGVFMSLGQFLSFRKEGLFLMGKKFDSKFIFLLKFQRSGIGITNGGIGMFKILFFWKKSRGVKFIGLIC